MSAAVPDGEHRNPLRVLLDPAAATYRSAPRCPSVRTFSGTPCGAARWRSQGWPLSLRASLASVILAGLIGLWAQPAGAQLPGPVTAITVGFMHTCALRLDGLAYCWGDNEHGQLGDGTTASRSTPTPVVAGQVPDGVRLVRISAGRQSTCAVGDDGHAYCWGAILHGFFGSETFPDLVVPTVLYSGQIPAGVRLVQVSVSVRGHACVLGDNGRAYCWGDNSAFQLGGGSMDGETEPIQVGQGTVPASVRFTAITTGGHSCALGDDGHAYCWGYNHNGQLGTGDTTDQVPSVVVAGEIPAGVRLTAISAGEMHTCGLGSDQRAYCWGWNIAGELGNGGPPAGSTVPVRVPGRYRQLTTGSYDTCAVRRDRRVSCWGSGLAGRLGTGDEADRQGADHGHGYPADRRGRGRGRDDLLGRPCRACQLLGCR